MTLGPSSRKGIRGWSVSQGSATAAGRGATAAVREAIGARRAFIGRVVVFVLVLWGGGTLLLGDKGYFRLRSLRAEGLAMARQNEDTQGRSRPPSSSSAKTRDSTWSA
jgi:hypothetical protein